MPMIQIKLIMFSIQLQHLVSIRLLVIDVCFLNDSDVKFLFETNNIYK